MGNCGGAHSHIRLCRFVWLEFINTLSISLLSIYQFNRNTVCLLLVFVIVQHYYDGLFSSHPSFLFTLSIITAYFYRCVILYAYNRTPIVELDAGSL